MTVVDVNTGKFTGSGGNLEETVTKNNLEAAEEIVRQLRLRDIGGIIVVDFIDMVLESNRDLVLRRLVECLGRDRTRHQVAEVTSLGLVQMTRKRIGTGLLEAFSENCEHCQGRGVIVIQDTPVEPDRSRRRRPPSRRPRQRRRRCRARQRQRPSQPRRSRTRPGRQRRRRPSRPAGRGDGAGEAEAARRADVAAVARPRAPGRGDRARAGRTSAVETPAVETPAEATPPVETPPRRRSHEAPRSRRREVEPPKSRRRWPRRREADAEPSPWRPPRPTASRGRHPARPAHRCRDGARAAAGRARDRRGRRPPAPATPLAAAGAGRRRSRPRRSPRS